MILTKQNLPVFLKGKFYSKENYKRLEVFKKKSCNFVNDFVRILSFAIVVYTIRNLNIR